MSMYIPDKFSKPKKCPVCDRLFIMPDAEAWAYKKKPGNNVLYFCKWSCMRKWEREHFKSKEDDEL